MVIKYCPTKSMIGDHMTKPLQGELFKDFRAKIMGNDPIGHVRFKPGTKEPNS